MWQHVTQHIMLQCNVETHSTQDITLASFAKCRMPKAVMQEVGAAHLLDLVAQDVLYCPFFIDRIDSSTHNCPYQYNNNYLLDLVAQDVLYEARERLVGRLLLLPRLLLILPIAGPNVSPHMGFSSFRLETHNWPQKQRTYFKTSKSQTLNVENQLICRS